MKIDPKDQPDLDTKIDCIMHGHLVWDYTFHVPPVTHSNWTPKNWIDYIGDNWFRKGEK